jgi:hypothetical protein
MMIDDWLLLRFRERADRRVEEPIGGLLVEGGRLPMRIDFASTVETGRVELLLLSDICNTPSE